MRKNKIKSLIFGISGQDGSYLSHFLLNKGHDIYGTTRNIGKKNLNNLNKLGVLNKIKIIKCNAKNFKITHKSLKIIMQENELHKRKFSPLYMSRNRRRKWDQVSFTIQANAMHVPLHPSSCEMVKEETDKFIFKPKNGKHRRFTPKECLAIQSFPRDYINKIKGSVQQQYTQIGNAVPPKLAEAIAKQLPEL